PQRKAATELLQVFVGGAAQKIRAARHHLHAPITGSRCAQADRPAQPSGNCESLPRPDQGNGAWPLVIQREPDSLGLGLEQETLPTRITLDRAHDVAEQALLLAIVELVAIPMLDSALRLELEADEETAQKRSNNEQ